MKLYVGNFFFDMTERTLRELFDYSRAHYHQTALLLRK